MAAYAALVSLEHIIDSLQSHSRPPIAISVHNEQPHTLTKIIPISLHGEQVNLLVEKVTFLQEFLQLYNPNLPYRKEADPLETRIARAAYAAEDAIESHIFYQLTNSGRRMSSASLYRALEKVIEDMTLIEKEAKEIHKETGWFHAKSTDPADPYRSSSSSKKNMMVGADDLLLELKDKLTSNRPDLHTIPIVGMGGSGKTTLALSVYQDRLIKERFDFCAWVTISQEYSIRQILTQFLSQLIKEFDHELSEDELGEMLYRHLFGRRYMVVLDDVWSVDAWDGINRFLPNNSNGSRIVITTRITSLASLLPNSNSLRMKLLNEDASWKLLSKTVFGGKCVCPLEFEEIGKKIGISCKGLPLSMVVVGGLLAKSEQTIELWESILGNLNAVVNLEDDERCLKTLYMSYKQLPVHLKPCFLYMGIYREDYEIRIPNLIRLWVAEGFLKLVRGKRVEDVARSYLKELIDRNLIIIHKIGSIGSIKFCKVHDLLRELCLKEAKKEGFYNVYPGHEIEDGVSRTISIKKLKKKGFTMSVARSLILDADISQCVPPDVFTLTRILHSKNESGKFLADNALQLVNSRLLSLCFTTENPDLSSLICLSWNLQTLIVHQVYERITVPIDIWYMSQIIHLYIDFLHLPNPPNVQANCIVLQNLQTLRNVKDFTCSEEVVKRIPNIRKLLISYDSL